MTQIIVPVPHGTSRVFGNGHNGIDYVSPVGTPVLAAADGVVAFEGQGQNHSWITWMGGISILLRHDFIHTGYAHLSRTVVNAGQRVSRGQVIGFTGNTGNSTGPHLHFEVLPIKPDFNNGYSGRINPAPYFVQQQAQPAKGGDMPIPNADNYFWRYNKAMIYIRGRSMSREEFNQNFVGRTDLEMLSAMLDSPEADAHLDYANWGRTAKNDKWADQIYALQAALEGRPSKEQLAEAQKAAAELQEKVDVATKEADVKAAENTVLTERIKAAEAQAEADRQAGDTLLRRIGQFISKYLPGSK